MTTRYSVDTQALKAAMAAAGFDTYIAFAKAIGISDTTVSAVVKGKNPTCSVMCKVADAPWQTQKSIKRNPILSSAMEKPLP